MDALENVEDLSAQGHDQGLAEAKTEAKDFKKCPRDQGHVLEDSITVHKSNKNK